MQNKMDCCFLWVDLEGGLQGGRDRMFIVMIDLVFLGLWANSWYVKRWILMECMKQIAFPLWVVVFVSNLTNGNHSGWTL